MDVMPTLTTNTALGDGVTPDQRRMRAEFPYFGEPYASTQQVAAAAQVSKATTTEVKAIFGCADRLTDRRAPVGESQTRR